MTMMNELKNNYISDIKLILAQAHQKAYSAINFAMVEAYWLIGQRIVEEEQHGKERAAYGEEIIKTLSIELTKEFGRGFSERSLWQFRQFYQLYPEFEIPHTPIAEFQIADNKGNAILRSPIAELKRSTETGYLRKLNWTQIQRILRWKNACCLIEKF